MKKLLLILVSIALASSVYAKKTYDQEIYQTKNRTYVVDSVDKTKGDTDTRKVKAYKYDKQGNLIGEAKIKEQSEGGQMKYLKIKANRQ